MKRAAYLGSSTFVVYATSNRYVVIFDKVCQGEPAAGLNLFVRPWVTRRKVAFFSSGTCHLLSVPPSGRDTAQREMHTF